ncbi:MAG: hypothetical protein KJO69_09260 [Gammaproteobacteria bacterium]|nr:hypothetical protein [Gammaproteobacteria bacterium]NNJ73005.1 hypothetical protein [Enterobacterales bacterium]
MAKQQKKSDSWLGMTILMMAALAFLIFFALFPSETLAAISDYIYMVVIAIVLLAVALLSRRVIADIKVKREAKLEVKRRKKIQLIEQLIWRSRYSLQSTKAQILADDTPEARELWKQEKIRYTKEKIFPVIPETEVPMNLVSSLIEKSLSGSSLGSSKLPTYQVKNL